MLKTLIKKELLEHFDSMRFVVLITICLLLIPLSLFVGFRDYENRISDYNQAVQLHRENLANAKQIELFTTGFAVTGFLPPSPLTVFATGLSDGMPQMFEASETGIHYKKSGIPDITILTLAGKIDFMFIIQIIFSLLAILFTFDAICGEREQGTLKAALANPVPRNTYILGKYIGTVIALLLPFLVSFTIGLLLIIMFGYPLVGSEIPLRIIALILCSAIYISVHVCIGLFVSSRVSSSKTSMIYLISLWILLIILIPKGSDIIAKVVSPLRSQEVVQLEKTMLRHNLELEKGAELDFIRNNPPVGIELTREALNEAQQPVRDEYSRRIAAGVAQIEKEYELEKNRRYYLARNLARIVPVTSFNKIMTDLAWTGELTKNNFKEHAQAFQDMLDVVVFNKIIRDISPDGSFSLGTTEPIDFDEIPQFDFSRSSLAKTFNSIVFDIGLLLFFQIFTFALLYVSFLRYDIR